MKISNVVLEENMTNRRIIKETAIKLIEILQIVDSELSYQLLGYPDLTLIKGVSQWLIDNRLEETIEEQDQFLNELTDELRKVLTDKAHELNLHWFIGGEF